jgi:AraC-like DNA-binding protein
MEYELFYHAIGEDDLTAKEHTHIDRTEVIHIVNGEGVILLGENTYSFSSGDVFFFDGSLLHSILPSVQQTYERNKLILNKSALSVLISSPMNKQIYFHADESTSAEIDQLFCNIEKCQQNDQHLLAMSSICQLLHLCLEEQTPFVPSDSHFRHQVMNYVNQHLQDALSIEHIASQIHMSKYHMCKRFKMETGITIGNYIRMQRLYLAKKRLEETNDSISMIAFDCGFSDLSHFTKLFKSIVKLTPSEYRKRFRKE